MDKSELLDWKMYVSPEESEAVQLKAFECEIYWAVPDNTPQVQWTKKDSLGIGDYGELCLNPVNNRRATTPYKWIALADKYLAQKNVHVNEIDVVESNHPEIPDSSEAVKADEPDWDNAPVGATHWCPKTKRWYKHCKGRWVVFHDGFHGWIDSRQKDDFFESLSSRPEPTQSPSDEWDGKLPLPPEWDGEGNPPIGEYCLFGSGDFSNAVKVKILTVQYGYIGFAYKDTKALDLISENSKFGFRPIKSKEEKHREEVIREIRKLISEMTSYHPDKTQSWALYEAITALQMPNKE